MLRQINSLLFLSILAAIVLFGIGSVSAVSLSPSISKLLDSFNSNENEKSDSIVQVIVFVEDDNQMPAPAKATSFKALDFRTKHKMVIEDLKVRNSNLLESISAQIAIINPGVQIKRFWIASALAFEIPLSQIDELTKITGVVSVIENGAVEYIQPVEVDFASYKTNGNYSHLEAMNIPALWDMGIDGSDRLICNFDTGVDGEHPALKSKWHGNSASAAASWFAPRQTGTTPLDVVGHGTQTMGIMVGGTDTDTIGVAPGAEWMGAAVVDQGQTLSNTISDILSAFEWIVDPDGNPETVDDMPDVVLNSWGIPTSIIEPCDETFFQVIDNVEAAGIVTIFAAGNEGPEPYSLRNPANSARSPLNSFSVGAIDHNTNLVASFSSRGPSSCDSTSIKPEVVAPGVGIYTTAKGGGYRYSTGTSMAAPIIAGLVALMRQYNPEATVEEIKNALIESATDLGYQGEDNDYGHGLPDAIKALALLPRPNAPEINITGTIIGDDGIADPMETFDLYVRLNAVSNSFDSLTGYLYCNDARISIIDNQSPFIFPPNSTLSANVPPFIVNVNDQILHGEVVPFSLIIDLPFGIPYDTLSFNLTVGTPPSGNMFTHISTAIEMTVSDFGQFGMAENSIYPAGGRGLRYKNSENILYEAGIIIGRNSLQLSSSIRDSLGRADQSDFSPISEIAIDYSTSSEGFKTYAEFTDSHADIQIPISVGQAITSFNEAGEDQFMIVRYFLKNNSAEPITDLSFGFFSDFDLSQTGDQIGVFSESNLYYQMSDLYTIGIMPLTDIKGILAIDNGDQKMNISKQDKFGYLNHDGFDINNTETGDYMSVLSFGPFNIMPHDSVEVALLIAVGESLSDVQYFSNLGAEKYFGVTDIENQADVLPSDFELGQNYPNPFNPATTISFQITRVTHARLSVINILGQEVSVLFDEQAQAGNHTIRWDGVDQNNSKVASGIYFYRLETDLSVDTKKMLMIK